MYIASMWPPRELFSERYFNNIHGIPLKWTFDGILGVHVTCILEGLCWECYGHSFRIVLQWIVWETSVLYSAYATDLGDKTNDSVKVPGG